MKKTLASLLACAMLVATMPMAMAANPTDLKTLLTESGYAGTVSGAVTVKVDMKAQDGAASFQDNLGPAKSPANTTLNFKADFDVADLKASYDAYIEKLVALINMNGGTETANLLAKLDDAEITGSFNATINADSGITMPADATYALSGDAATIFTMNAPVTVDQACTITFDVNPGVTKADFDAAFAAGNTLTLTCEGATIAAYGSYNVVGTFSGATDIWDGTDKIASLIYNTADPEAADTINITISAPSAPPAGGGSLTTPIQPDGPSTPSDTTITVPADTEGTIYTVPSTIEKNEEVKIAFAGAAVPIALPVNGADNGTILVRVDENDEEVILKKAFVEDKEIIVALTGNTTIKAIDNDKHFIDVPATSWFADCVDFVAAREIFNGTAPQIFSPNGDMTRGMFAQVINNLEYNPNSTVDDLFNDMNGHWSIDAVHWAAEAGIVTGYPDGSFRADKNISREQIAAMLYRYAGSPEVEIDLGDFEDADDVSEYAEAAISWAIAEGIITGVTSTTLKPGNNATRAQVAAMLMRYIISLR